MREFEKPHAFIEVIFVGPLVIFDLIKQPALFCRPLPRLPLEKLYDHLHEVAGDVDVVFLGMECDGAPLSWLYGPLLTKPLPRKLDQSRRFDGSDRGKGMSLVRSLKPAQVYVYAMGQEPWLVYLTSIQYTDGSRPIVESNGLVEQCRAEGIVSERLFRRKELLLEARGT